jgi:hypothetical protein
MKQRDIPHSARVEAARREQAGSAYTLARHSLVAPAEVERREAGGKGHLRGFIEKWGERRSLQMYTPF